MSALDISSDLGLVALGLLTLNLLLGFLLSTKYNPVRNWPHRRINTVKIHNWTGYVALVAVLAHPALLLLAPKEGFGVVDLLYPVNAPRQPWINTLGAAALYLLVVVVATSIFRFEIGRKIWKPIHFSAYAAALLFFVHGFLTDPQLKDRPVDPVDAEKAFVELCFLLVLAATIVRIRYGLRRPSKRKAPRSALEPGT